MRVLILGGTTEASALARLLAGDRRFFPILSLAGRTSMPKAQPIATRIGGFGGQAGLVQWLREEDIAAVVDATHPYAVQISRNAVAACATLRMPLGSVVRERWQRMGQDRWSTVGDVTAAVVALGMAPARVFLSLGRLELAAFAEAPQHTYLARLIERPGDIALPPKIDFVFARGPFGLEAERLLLSGNGIDILVSKNSGGQATYAKIAAARELGLKVVMIDRPHKPCGEELVSAPAALSWLEAHLTHRGTPSSLRGV